MTTTDDARERFEQLGLSYDDVLEEDLMMLAARIAAAIGAARRAGSLTVPSLRVSPVFEAEYREDGSVECCFIRCRSDYFEDRELVSFNRDGFIGLCGWADSHNAAPVVAAFCDWAAGLAVRRMLEGVRHDDD